MGSGWKTFTGLVLMQLAGIVDQYVPGFADSIKQYIEPILNGLGALFVVIGLVHKAWRKVYAKKEGNDNSTDTQ